MIYHTLKYFISESSLMKKISNIRCVNVHKSPIRRIPANVDIRFIDIFSKETIFFNGNKKFH